MTSDTLTMSRATGGENQELPDVESLHWTGPLSLLVGLLSPLALFGPLLWFIPILGAITSCLALRYIDPSYRRVIHRVLPVGGLILSLLFGAWGPSRSLSRNSHIEQQAEQFGRQWIGMIQSAKLHEAHQMCMPPDQRTADSRMMLELYSTSDNIEKLYRRFIQDPFVKDLSDLGETATVNYEGMVDLQVTDEYDAIVQNYTVTGTLGSAPLTLLLKVDLRRLKPGPSRTSHWEVSSYSKRFSQ